MSEKTRIDDQAFIAEAVRRMKSSKPGIPGHQVQAFLKKFDEEWDRAGELSEAQIREMFNRFIAEANHVSG